VDLEVVQEHHLPLLESGQERKCFRWASKATPSVAPSTLIAWPIPSALIAAISVRFLSQFLGTLPKARSPLGALA